MHYTLCVRLGGPQSQCVHFLAPAKNQTIILGNSSMQPITIPIRLCLLGIFIEINTLVSLTQVSELETEFEKVKGEKVVPARYLKSQQQKQAKLAAEVTAAGGDGEGEIVN